jgi:OPA family glycerol-3-phosphate transporter-like MFS transporter
MSPALRTWRSRVFASTWLCYVGFYLCRKPFYIAKSELGNATGWDASDLAFIGSAYLIAYAAGQFIAGWAGTRGGARRLLLAGMALSVLSNVVFGLTNNLGLFATFMAINGLAQATGWAGTVSTMGNWFMRRERGTVMGFWATCFQFGGVFGNGLAAWALGKWGFEYSFFCGSAAMLLVIAFFALNQRNAPEDVGLKLPIGEEEGADPASSTSEIGGLGWSRSTLNTVLIVGSFYFFVKFIRYALWSWVPFFLSRNYGLEGDDAGYLSTVFDLCGIAGVIVCGWMSDRYFKGKRAKISVIFLVLMAASCILMYTAGQVAVALFGISLGLVGFSLYGPDALMTGAAAQDIGGRSTAMAAGIINGMGSIGAVVQEFVIGRMYDKSAGDLGPIFAMLVVAAVLACLSLGVVLYRNRQGISDV